MERLSELLLNFSYLGESLSASSAFIWASAIILFRVSGRTVHPLGLNFFKNLFSCLVFPLTMWALNEAIFLQVSWKSYGLLIISGIIGIAVSDTLLFASLNRLGAGLSAIVSCFYSPFVILLSFIFIGERMSLLQLLGVLLIISAVLTISQENHRSSISPKNLLAGIILGIGAMFSLAVSIVMIKPLLNRSPLLWATLVRSVAGMLVLGVVILFHPKGPWIWKSTFTLKNWKPMVPGSLLGGYLALITWMGGMKFTFTSIASALNQLTTIFIFVMGILFLKEKATKERIAAVFIGVIGGFLVTFF